MMDLEKEIILLKELVTLLDKQIGVLKNSDVILLNNINVLGNTTATSDNITALTGQIRVILTDVNTLSDTVSDLDTDIDKISYLLKLKDITITYITEGDLLQYSSDGTFHNITLELLGLLVGEIINGGIKLDSATIKAMIKSEGSKYFLSKLLDDTALGVITFNNGLNSNGIARLKKGATFGNFTTGIFTGSGAKIDEFGNCELKSLTIREFLLVPELRFNRVDVVSGETWNTVAYGIIEDVDTENKIITLKLEDGEYSGIHLNDICRGIYHNMTNNSTTTEKDSCNFNQLPGFSTSYFTPVLLLDAFGKKFVYSLKPETTTHPSKYMKFVVYGNFTDKTRRNSAFSTKAYTRYLKDVQTWSISSNNIASQYGDLEGVYIKGAPNDGYLQGNGLFADNVYLTNALVLFTREQEDLFAGQDAYSVMFDRETFVFIVDNEFNIIDEYQQLSNLEFKLLVFKGKTELQYSDIMSEGKYSVDYTATGVTCTFSNGIFKITGISKELINNMNVSVSVNCEGNVVAYKKLSFNYQLEVNSYWVTYNDNDATPDRPTGEGNEGGWHRNFTSTSVWMSTKNSRKLNQGEWGNPVRFIGASVAGKDGEYTAFCYTNAYTQPETPVSNQIPPVDSTRTWYMYPPARPSKEVFTYMTQATVYSDKTLSGWTTPIRITGETGEDGADGSTSEYIYKVTSTKTAPETPSTSQLDDYIPFGWTDNPVGVSKDAMYEWVCIRVKPRGINSEWGEFSTPVLWSKWGEKGMDGDGYEYIFTRTTGIDRKPNTPNSIQLDEYLPTTSNGGSTDYNWSDDPKGVSESYKAEWTCKRKRYNGSWGPFSEPSLWSNWGDIGLSGGNYQYRWKKSESKPTTTPDNDNTWVLEYDDNIQVEENMYVWLILRFKNADGTFTAWNNIIRITGANGKDGEDGNSIQFIYHRTSTDSVPTTPVQTSNDFPDGWTDHPEGVTHSLMYEWVSLRMLDKSTLLWSAYSTPGLWARYSERGKDGDGFEYIYRRSPEYLNQSQISSGGVFYPPTTNSNYQNDDYVPDNYTDNPIGPNETYIYEYMWNRKKKNSVWGLWSNGALWARYSEDGKDAVFIDLTNDISTVLCDKYGNVSGYIQPTTAIVYRGNDPDEGWQFFGDFTGCSGTVNVTTGKVIINSIVSSVDSCDVLITATKTGYSDLTTTYRVSKIYPGADGEPGDLYWLVPSVSSIKRNKDNTLNPSVISCDAWHYKGNTISTDYSEIKMTVKINDGAEYNYAMNKLLSLDSNTENVTFFIRKLSDNVIMDAERLLVVGDGKDGEKGDPGDLGESGYSIIVTGYPASIRSSKTYLQTTSATLRVFKQTSDSQTIHSGYWIFYYKDANTSQWIKSYSTTSAQSSVQFSWSSTLNASSMWFACSKTNLSTPSDTTECMWSVEIPVVYDGADGDKGDPGDVGDIDTSYSIMRDRGYWNASTQYYNDLATNAMSQDEYERYTRYQDLTVIDYVCYKGNIYLAKANNSGQTPSSISVYWTQSSKMEVLTVNNLLANNATIGDFTVSNNVFTSSNGNLVMDSTNGTLSCNNAVISGDITATSGSFTGTVHATDGEFTGTVNATSGSFTGDIHAANGEFTGIVTAKNLLFLGNSVIPLGETVKLPELSDGLSEIRWFAYPWLSRTLITSILQPLNSNVLLYEAGNYTSSSSVTLKWGDVYLVFGNKSSDSVTTNWNIIRVFEVAR